MSRNNRVPLIQHPGVTGLIGFNLQMATLRVVARTREHLADAGISPAKVTALSLLQMNPGCDQSALGRALQINRASAMKLVNSLAARGLVERKNGRDLRTKALYLTPSGKCLLEDCLPLIEEADAKATSVMNEVERELLRGMLERLGKAPGGPGD